MVTSEHDDLASRMRRLAFEISVGWDDERNTGPTYVAYGQAFREAARRILVELDATQQAKEAPDGGE